MNTKWPIVPLKKVLKPVSRPEPVDPEKTYHILGAHWYAQGLYTKYVLKGSQIRAPKVYRIEKGDFVYNRLFAWKGSFAVAIDENDGCYVSNEFPSFVIDNNSLDSKYIWRLFSCDSIWDKALGLSTGGTPTSRNRLKEEKLLAMNISLPPLDEQHRIVARIEELAARIEEARELRRRAVEETEALIPSILSKTFDYIPLDALPAGWIWRPLNSILINKKEGLTTGPFGTLLQKSEIRLDGIPILGISNVESNRFVPGFRDYITPEKADFLSSYKLRAGDIVIARSGTVGRSCIIPEGLASLPIMSTNLLRMRLNTNEFSPKLLCMLLNSSALIETLKDKECRGSTRDFFTQKILFKLILPVPPLDEQYGIVAYLEGMQSKLDALKRHQTETAAELDALMPSILDKAFNGEL